MIKWRERISFSKIKTKIIHTHILCKPKKINIWKFNLFINSIQCVFQKRNLL